MNKQIDKLVIATDAWCDQNLPTHWTDDVDKYLPVWNEKFAELIIKECVEKIHHNENLNWLNAAQAAKDLKKHFGVE